MDQLDIENSIVLLGAGASRPACVPTAFEMTDRMLAMFEDDPLQRHYLGATRMIIGALQMASGVRSEGPNSKIDIEQVLSAAKLVSTRFCTGLSPFVGAWHPLLEELERAYLAILIENSGANANAEIARLLSRRHDGRWFQTLVTVLTAKLMHLTWLTDHTRSEYFHPLLTTARTRRLIIATLNYDNTVEGAAATLNLPCHTLGDWQATATLPEPSNGIDLLKLHGSTNWKWSNQPRASAGCITPPRTICEVDSVDMPNRLRRAKWYPNRDYVGDSLGVMFGGGNKLTAEGPFMDLFHKFKRLLWEKRHLLVIGYSFRDVHINHLIEHWFTTKPATTLIIVDAPTAEKNMNRFYRAHEDEIDKRLFYDGSGIKRALLKYFPKQK
jgi:hypothetical protein